MTREEAIKVVKSATVYTPEEMKALETLIPELRESEDEMVGKWLIEYFKDYYDRSGDTFCGMQITRILAYLEKQKEQKPNYCHHEVDETGWTEEYRKAYYDGWNNCNMQHSQLKAEQKPAEWSEEDEKMREHIISDLREFRDCETDEELVSDYEDEIAWLKSLRPSWKPSKEQMDRLFSIVAALRKDYCDDMADFLASLYKQLKAL